MQIEVDVVRLQYPVMDSHIIRTLRSISHEWRPPQLSILFLPANTALVLVLVFFFCLPVERQHHQGLRRTHTFLFNDVMCAKSPLQCCDNGTAPASVCLRTMDNFRTLYEKRSHYSSFISHCFCFNMNIIITIFNHLPLLPFYHFNNYLLYLF